jgi:hypothetical protein
MNNTITSLVLQDSLSYEAYINFTKEIIASTHPPEIYRDEKMMNYTKDNLARMQDLNENIEIEPKLYNQLQLNTTPWTWVCITEPWCGDASQIVPILYFISKCSDLISFKILLRDNHTDVMDNYLTKGGRSIPKLVCLKSEDLSEVGRWGPRPKVLQDIVTEKLKDPNMSFGEKVRMVHQWYSEDKTTSTQIEFIDIINNWRNTPQ